MVGAEALCTLANNKASLNVKKNKTNPYSSLPFLQKKIQGSIMWISHQQQGIAQLPYRSITHIDSHHALPPHTFQMTSTEGMTWCTLQDKKGLTGGFVMWPSYFWTMLFFFVTKHYQCFVPKMNTVSSQTLCLLQFSVETKCFFQLFQSTLRSIYSPFFSNWKSRQQFFSTGSPVIAESKESSLEKAAQNPRRQTEILLDPPNLLMCYWWNSGFGPVLSFFWVLLRSPV